MCPYSTEPKAGHPCSSWVVLQELSSFLRYGFPGRCERLHHSRLPHAGKRCVNVVSSLYLVVMLGAVVFMQQGYSDTSCMGSEQARIGLHAHPAPQQLQRFASHCQDAEQGRHREYIGELRSTYLARGKGRREVRPLKKRVRTMLVG